MGNALIGSKQVFPIRTREQHLSKIVIHGIHEKGGKGHDLVAKSRIKSRRRIRQDGLRGIQLCQKVKLRLVRQSISILLFDSNTIRRSIYYYIL